jgi:hypothetical protein
MCILILSFVLSSPRCIIIHTTTRKEAAKTNMMIVQAKLQECITSSQMNSFDRLSNLFAGVNNDANVSENVDEREDDEDVVMLTSASSAGKRSSSRGGKDASKIPTKKTTKMTGQYGDRTSRKMGEKKSRKDGSTSSSRGRGRSIEGRRSGRSSSKKRGSGKKLATI